MSRMLRIALVCTLALLGTASGALASGITNSGDDLRTGWYPNEGAISPQLVSGGTFGKLWSASVEGQVYAQPLLSNGTLLVATEANKVYGLNPASGTAGWSRSLGTPWNASDIGCGDLTPTIGVTATPVIDTATNTAYMTHKTYKKSGEGVWYMDAIEMTSGEERSGFPVELSGSAQNAPGQAFQPERELQRPGLLLMEGVVYAAFGSDCDLPPYQGWVFGVSIGEHTVKARWTSETTTNESGAGIWQSGAGLTSDGPGTILLSTGNGPSPALGTPGKTAPGKSPPGSLGESVVRLNVRGDGSLETADFFAPFEAEALSKWDADFGSGGVTGLPSQYFGTPATPDLAVAVGKDGYVYLLNRDNLGGIGEGPGGTDNVVQRVGPNGGVWSRPGVWPGEGGWVYIPTASNGGSGTGSSGYLQVYKYGVSGTGTPTLSLQGTSSSEPFGFSSSAPVITSEGTHSGTALVWVVWAPNAKGEGAQLRAYNPVPVQNKPVLRWSAPIGTSAKFALPGVGAGRLYVGTRDGHVLAFGSPVTQALTGSATEFPKTTVGSSSQPKTVTLTATKTLTLTNLASSPSPEFQLGTPSRTLPATMAAGDTIQVPVTFSPAQPGPQAGTLTATTSAGSVSFGLSGSGQVQTAQLDASPTVLSFGGTSPGQAISETATFSNVGAQPLRVTGVRLPGAPFVATGVPPQGHEIGPEESITVTIEFKPTTTGTFNGEIELQSTGGNATVVLAANSSTPGALQITNEVNYGQVAVGTTSTKTFTVTDTGGTAVEITKSKPPSSGAFTATSSLAEGTTIGAGESVTETVAFKPTAAGPASGAWALNGKDTTGLHEVILNGVGTVAESHSSETHPPEALVPPVPGGSGTLGTQVAVLPKVGLPGTLVASHTGIIPVKLSCPVAESSCAGTIRLWVKVEEQVGHGTNAHRFVEKTLASGSFRIAGGRTTTIHLRLSATGRAKLARQHLLRVSATILAHDPAGAKHATLTLVRIRLGK